MINTPGEIKESILISIKEMLERDAHANAALVEMVTILAPYDGRTISGNGKRIIAAVQKADVTARYDTCGGMTSIIFKGHSFLLSYNNALDISQVLNRYNTFATVGMVERSNAVNAIDVDQYATEMAEAIFKINQGTEQMKALREQGNNYQLPSLSRLVGTPR